MKLLFLMHAFSGDAQAKKDKKEEGVTVTITVLDEESKTPLSTARILHPLEHIDHQVNSVTGSWKESVLFLTDGTTLYFSPGSSLDLTISAPGYISQEIQLEVKHWRNKHTIYLSKSILTEPIQPMPTEKGTP